MFALLTIAVKADPPLPGAIFTTDSTCTGVDLNIYGDKHDVYLNGGPAHPGAASLPAGNYYVQVTDPSGACVLGTSLGTADPTPFHVAADGSANCIQLCQVLTNAGLDATCALGGVADAGCGYNTTPNPGGEYKVWVSTESTFTNNSTKTDNFKVKGATVCVPNPTPCPSATPQGTSICVNKFYDANANGVQDGPNEVNIVGWKYCVVGTNNFSNTRFTFDPPRCLIVDPDTYTVYEDTPVEANWVHTTATVFTFPLAAGETHNVSFGNVCLGPGGGLTLGFWSNKNGQNLENASDFVLLTNLCLVNGDGSPRDFTSSLSNNKSNLHNWLLGANAVNMANMLSAQLAAMELNVAHNKVSGSALIYEACLKDYGYPTGFVSINNLMSAANSALCADGNTPSGDPNRAKQECLKDALDDANNNLNFVQGSPCPFSFGANDTCPFTNP